MVAQEEYSSSVNVNNDLGYPVIVAPSTRAALADAVREYGARFVVLCDARPAVHAVARRDVSGLGDCLGVIPIPLGERRKSLNTVERVLAALVESGADRGTLIVGFGGGVAGDLFGLCAALFMRGVPYVHVATSLVAMVDAAIGGKTGVDLKEGKNLAGVFSDPRAVLCPIGALDTLPYRHLREGLAEVVKHGVIEGDELFDALEQLAPHPFEKWPWEVVVSASIKVKTMIVADDRTERGQRALLNLGHTFAHGIERATGYRVSHGAAVSLGLRAAGLLALRTGRFSAHDHLRVITLLALLRMPLYLPNDVEDVYEAMHADKKKRDGRLQFVLPNAIGDVEFGIEVSERAVRDVLKRLTKPPTAAECR